MSGRGGKRKGAGRKPSSLTQRTREAAEKAKLTPLEYMLNIVCNPKADERRRDDLAKAAAPYCHPRLAAVEHSGKDGAALDLTWVVKFVKPNSSA